jgi:hypothetical protein
MLHSVALTEVADTLIAVTEELARRFATVAALTWSLEPLGSGEADSHR